MSIFCSTNVLFLNLYSFFLLIITSIYGLQLNVPSEYHRSLIGTKGATIRKLSEDYNVQIKVPNQEQNADIIKVTKPHITYIIVI